VLLVQRVIVAQQEPLELMEALAHQEGKERGVSAGSKGDRGPAGPSGATEAKGSAGSLGVKGDRGVAGRRVIVAQQEPHAHQE
jgi:hypothetical protein